MDVRTLEGPNGERVHLLSGPASALPSVAKRDIEMAWELAREDGVAAGVQCFRFAGEPPVELVLADRDAASWAGAVERRIGLGTAHGVSVCLRLLALVALMAQAGWARDWFVLERGEALIRPELLRAAALVRLNEAGGFDETRLAALLPRPAARDAGI